VTDQPHFGHTRHGLPVHLRTADHLPARSAYARFNKRVALGVTGFVGSMTCGWVFCLLALLSLPAVLTQAFSLHVFPHWLVAVGLIALVAWIAQTFLQLVLLSVIMVGQNVQQAASDARAAKQFEDTERIVDALDLKTEGGLAEVLAAVQQVRNLLAVPAAGQEADGLLGSRPPAAGPGVLVGDGGGPVDQPPAAEAARQPDSAAADKRARGRNRAADKDTAGGTGGKRGDR
jgi:hypothetical protein